MKKIKLLTGLSIIAPACALLPTISSCSSDSTHTVKSIDGSDWEGVVAGNFQSEQYEINVFNKSVKYTNGCNIYAQNLVVPNNVVFNNEVYWVEIGELCFLGNTNIVGSVEMNDYANSVASNAFNGCKKLECLIMHCPPTTIGAYAFCSCSSFTGIFIRYSFYLDGNWTQELISVDDSAFENTLLCGDFYGTEKLILIGNRAFYNCYDLLNVNLANCIYLQTIYNQAFYNCWSIQHLYLPKNLTRIGRAAFNQCLSLSLIHLPEDDMEITLGNSAFSSCDRLQGFDKSVRLIKCGTSCFRGDKQLRDQLWNQSPNYMDIIDANAFSNTSYYSVKFIPYEYGGPIDVGEFAFSGCSNLCILDFSEFDSVPQWSGYFIFTETAKFGSIYLSEEQYNDGNVDQSWYDFFTYQGLQINSSTQSAWKFMPAAD